MKCFGTDANNDLVIIGRNLQVVEGIDATLAVCEHAAQAILGEMVLAKNQGMPFFQTVWVGGPTTAPFEAAFRSRISTVPGVVRIESLEVAFVGDVMQYRAQILTTYGVGAISGEFNG